MIYYIVKMVVEQKLEKKKMPADTEAYGRVEYLDDNGTFQYVKDDIKERTEDADSSTK